MAGVIVMDALAFQPTPISVHSLYLDGLVIVETENGWSILSLGFRRIHWSGTVRL